MCGCASRSQEGQAAAALPTRRHLALPVVPLQPQALSTASSISRTDAAGMCTCVYTRDGLCMYVPSPPDTVSTNLYNLKAQKADER